MAMVSGGFLQSVSVPLHNVAGNGCNRALLCIGSYNNCSANEKKNGNASGKKGVRRKDDLSYTRRRSNWWIPLFGWSPDQKWAEQEEEENGGCQSVESADVVSVQNAKNSAHNVRESDEEEEKKSKERRGSKFVRVHFTPEKAKLLRKNLRSTSTFHDLMYHSAIASRLATADSSSSRTEDSKQA